MTRALLACLLLLCGCSPKDPEGTLQPDKDGGLEVPVRNPGDSKPFRLTGGDTQMILTVPIGESDAPEIYEGCTGVIDLYAYPDRKVQSYQQSETRMLTVRMNALSSGVYFLRYQPTDKMCNYTAFFSKS